MVLWAGVKMVDGSLTSLIITREAGALTQEVVDDGELEVLKVPDCSLPRLLALLLCPLARRLCIR